MKVDVDTLKEHYPSEFQEHFLSWAEGQHDVLGMMIEEDMPHYIKEELEGTGWLQSNAVNYRVASSQGDGVAVDSTVYRSEMSEATLDELRQDFPMCLELLGCGFLHVWSICSPRDVCSVIKWVLDPMQENEDYEDFGGCVYRLKGGLYDGLPESVAFQVADAEGFDRFADVLGDRLHNAEHRLYLRIRDEIEFQTSEEMFIEQMRDLEETFEV